MSYTRTQLVQHASNHYLLGDLTTGQATSGTTLTLIDTSDDSPFTSLDAADRFKSYWLYVNAGTHAGVERRVTTSATTTLTVGLAVSGAYDSTDVYELRSLTSRRELVNALNRALTQRLFYRTEEPVGLLADGDGSMEDSGTSYWTPSNCAVAKESAENDFIFNGIRSLKLTATTSAAYAESQGILVTEQKSYRIEAWVLPYFSGANRSSATLAVYDYTNSAEITLTGGTTTAAHADGAAWQRLWATFTVPENCGIITVRLKEGTANAISYWDDVWVDRTDRRTVNLPNWVNSAAAFEWIYARVSDTNRRELRPVKACLPRFMPAGAGLPQAEVSAGDMHYPLYVAGFRNYGSLDTDAATVALPEAHLDWLIGATVVELLGPLTRARRYGDREQLKQDFIDAQLYLSRQAIAHGPKRQHEPMWRPRPAR